jgi:Mg2+ and Co2+ transporter CorA
VHVLTEVEPKRIAELRAAGHFFWIDLVGPSEDTVKQLGETLDLHPVALEELHAQLAQQPTHDEERLVYSIFDGLTDAFYPVIDVLENEIDALEADVLSHPRRVLHHLTYLL